MARGLELLDSELVDAMVVDLQLEKGSGMEVLAAVRARAHEVPVIILTAHGSIESAVEAMARGAYGFLTKPFHDHELMEKLAHGVESARLKRELAGLRRLVDQESSGLVGTSEPIHRVRERCAARHGIDPPALSREAMALLSAHAWPGNVRELANVMEGAALLTRREVLEADDVRSVLPAAAPVVPAAPTPPRAPAEAPGWQHAPTVPLPPLKEAKDAFARAYLLEALRRSDGVVAAAARLAGRNRTDFHDLLRRHGLSSSRAREE